MLYKLKGVACIVQMPFSSLDYFPDKTYFSRLENWYRDHVSPSMKVPSDGIWEVPLWVTWIRAFLLTAADDLMIELNVKILDLSNVSFDDFDSERYFINDMESELFILSPLLQNYPLAETVASFLRGRKKKVIIGGVMAEFADVEYFDYIFVGRIEHNYQKFLDILAEIFRANAQVHEFSFSNFQHHISYEWAKHYSDRIIYLRLFTQFGCPLNCLFCSDRRTGVDIIPSFIIERELWEINRMFPYMDVLYIGDLTFGVNKNALPFLQSAIKSVQRPNGKEYKVIVQTNPSMINEQYLQELKKLNVKVIEIGIESGSIAAAQRVEKKRPSVEWLDSRIELMLNNGFSVAGNIIIGLPHDVDDDYLSTKEWIARWKDKIWFNIYGFVPYFNTPLFKALKSEMRITNWNLSDWCEGKDLVFMPYLIDKGTVRKWFIEILEASRS